MCRNKVTKSVKIVLQYMCRNKVTKSVKIVLQHICRNKLTKSVKRYELQIMFLKLNPIKLNSDRYRQIPRALLTRPYV